MDAVKLLCEETMKAAVLILRDRGIANGADPAKLSADLRSTLRAEIDRVMAEWQEAIGANLGEAWLREMMNIQCNELALKALRAGEWIS